MTEAMRSAPRISMLPAVLASWRSLAARYLYADLLAALTAATLPWSTSGFAILLGVWFLALVPLLPTLDVRGFLRLLARPICLAPLALVALAVAGTLWADGSWREQLHGLSPLIKLLMIPFLLYHFERSQ